MIFEYTGKGWRRSSGKAWDIGVGSEGSVWVIGTNKEGGGFGIYRMNANKKGWRKIPGSAVRISVGPDGNAWVVNKKDRIYAYNGRRWVI
jgi:hypothetical protein